METDLFYGKFFIETSLDHPFFLSEKETRTYLDLVLPNLSRGTLPCSPF